LADTGPQKTLPGILMMVIGGGIVCGLVILAGWWLFSEKSLPPPVAPQKINQQSLQQPEVPSAIQKELKTSEGSVAAVESATPSADTIVPQKTTYQIPESAPVIIPRPSPPAIEQKGVMHVDEQTAESTIQLPETPSPEIIEQVPAEKVAVALTRVPQVPIKAKEIVIPPLRDPEMKLQAITWSRVPQKRVVVINNRILREGETVHGYRIETINQDDVILGEKGEKWKLLFRIK
jgi:hypothetical protein